MNLNPLADLLDRALTSSERRKDSVYLAEPTPDENLPDLIHRGKVIDNGGYAADWHRNPRFRHTDVRQFRHYRLVFIKGDSLRPMTTRDMLARHDLERVYGHASAIELVRIFVLHRKAMLGFMKSGKILTAIGYDMFSSTYFGYPEIALDEGGRVVLTRKESEPGAWSSSHILVRRTTLAA